MSGYIIEGGNRLEGIVDISGSKNASLPIIAASILNGGITKLYNVPNIHDTQITLKIFSILGCKVDKKNGKIIIDSSSMNSHEIPDDLMRQMRSSVVLAGAILARFKKVKTNPNYKSGMIEESLTLNHEAYTLIPIIITITVILGTIIAAILLVK